MGIRDTKQGGERISGKYAEDDDSSAVKSNDLEENPSEKEAPNSSNVESDVLGEIPFKEATNLSEGKHDGLEEIALEIKNLTEETKIHKSQIWAQIRPALGVIECMMSSRVKKKRYSFRNEHDARSGEHLDPIEEMRPVKGASEDESEEEFYDADKLDSVQEASSSENADAFTVAKPLRDGAFPEPSFLWKEELECLVHGGVPMGLRGEVQ